MKIKSAILAIVLIILCSCQKDKFQKISQSDCFESQNCSWNGCSVEFYNSFSHIAFVSKLNGDLCFELSQLENDGNKYLSVTSRYKNSFKQLVHLSTVDEIAAKSYSIGVTKNDTIHFYGNRVVVSDITISSDGHAGIDDNDNQGDGWEDDF